MPRLLARQQSSPQSQESLDAARQSAFLGDSVRIDGVDQQAARRAHMRALMHFIDEMPAAAVRVPTFNLAFLPRFQKMSREDFVAMAESKPLRREFMLTMGQTGFPKLEMEAALARLRRALIARIPLRKGRVRPGRVRRVLRLRVSRRGIP